MSIIAIQGNAIEEASTIVKAKLTDHGGTLLLQADFTSIHYEAWNMDASPVNQVKVATALNVANVVFDTLQTDARWTADATGYNFLHAMPATAFPTGKHTYKVEYKVTPASGAVFWLVFEGFAEEIITS